MDLREAYRVLELAAGASEDAVRDARNTLAKVWHPDRHANDPELAKKAQVKLSSINTAFATIRDAKFPASVPEPKPTTLATVPARVRKATQPPADLKPPPPPAEIEFVPRRRVRWSVILVLALAVTAGTYLAITKLANRSEGRDRIVDPPHDPPPIDPPLDPTPDPTSRDASHIAPRPPSNGKTFDLGATTEEVRAVQGEPTETLDMLGMWHYGFSTITFKKGVVVGYWNTDSNLRVRLIPGDAAAADKALAIGGFSIGASKDEVIGLQGTPDRIDTVIDETWFYPNGSSIVFDKAGRVKSVDDFGSELRFHR